MGLPLIALPEFIKLLHLNLQKAFHGKYDDLSIIIFKHVVIGMLGGAGGSALFLKINSGLVKRKKLPGFYGLILLAVGEIINAIDGVKRWKETHYWNGHKFSLEMILDSLKQEKKYEMTIEDNQMIWEEIKKAIDDSWREIINKYIA